MKKLLLSAIALAFVSAAYLPSTQPAQAVPNVNGGTKLIIVGDLVPLPDRASRPQAEAVARQARAENAAAYIFPGDLVYDVGAYSEYLSGWDLLWGRQPNFYPVRGNHDIYSQPVSSHYERYWGTNYGASYWNMKVNLPSGNTVGILAYNANCGRYANAPSPSCTSSSTMVNWMRSKLDADTSLCDIVVGHQPRFATKAPYGNDWRQHYPFWVSKNRGVDLFISGHNHSFERFYPQNQNGVRDPNGLRQFIVGTGGASLIPFSGPVTANSYKRISRHGYLRVTLTDTTIKTEFVALGGAVLDTGLFGCK